MTINAITDKYRYFLILKVLSPITALIQVEFGPSKRKVDPRRSWKLLFGFIRDRFWFSIVVCRNRSACYYEMLASTTAARAANKRIMKLDFLSPLKDFILFSSHLTSLIYIKQTNPSCLLSQLQTILQAIILYFEFELALRLN